MLAEDLSPVIIALHLSDPSEASFVLRKLSPGLVRITSPVEAAVEPASESISSKAAAGVTLTDRGT